MLSRRVVHPLIAAWRPIVAVVVALAVLTPAWADEKQKDQSANPPKKAVEKSNAPKSKADLEKARADVKRLEGEMDKLHLQLLETGHKLRKAHASLAEQGGEEGNHHFTRDKRRMWTHFRHAWRHEHAGWRRFAHHHIHHRMDEAGDASGLDQKVDRLQKQVEQLQRQLQEKK